MHPDQMPINSSTESPLRTQIYLIGFATVMGEDVPEEELADARQKVEAKRAATLKDFAMSL